MSDLKMMNRCTLAMRRVEPYAPEFWLALASTWAAWSLINPNENFARWPSSFRLLVEIGLPPGFWPAFALTAAVAKFGGLAMLSCRRRSNASLLLRWSGLAMSVAFWLSLGSSFLFNDQRSISGGAVVIMALWAMWILVRLPMLPGEPR